ncbi:MAG: purine-nucleoside phosphorylase [Bacteroidales bacterium]|nr:purine-nucleoside phosphorylase [Bacteroidales bacterium]
MTASADYILNHLGTRPSWAITLGSGLGRLADEIENPTVIPYSDIPGFRRSTAVGHKGNLIAGRLGNSDVIAMQGRFHYYEGYSMDDVTLPVRVMSELGVHRLVVSNAAGAVNPDYRVGDIMLISDHINLMPNPLIGPNRDEYGVRFPDMTEAYSPTLRAAARAAASALGFELREGVYIATTGPSYETPAEYRFFRTAGADAVGMSTVPEVIVARHCGLEVLGLSVITNQSNDLGNGTVNDGNDVVRAADAGATRLIALVRALL